jgi:DNA polymerase-3 subunit alpha
LSSSFVHLHAHSAYSLSEGAIKAEKLPALARAAGMPAVALTDTANLFGALEFAQGCTAKGVQPIMGCQLFLGRAATEEAGRAHDPQRSRPDPVVALARNAEGLENLQRLSSAGFLGSDPSGEPCVTLETLANHAAGLILLTGGTTGPLGRLLAEGRRDAARRLLAQLREVFGPDDLVVELHRHGLAIERAIEPALLRLADEHGVPIAAANDVYFAEAAMHQAHDALLCIAEGRVLAEQDRRRVTREHWFKRRRRCARCSPTCRTPATTRLASRRSLAVGGETASPSCRLPEGPPGMNRIETRRGMAQEGLERR